VLITYHRIHWAEAKQCIDEWAQIFDDKTGHCKAKSDEIPQDFCRNRLQNFGQICRNLEWKSRYIPSKITAVKLQIVVAGFTGFAFRFPLL